MGLVRTTDATVEPVTKALMKAQLGIASSVSGHDDYIDFLIKAAREEVESKSGRALITQTWKLTLDVFPECIVIPRPPLISITSLKYQDSSDVQQALVSGTDYQLDAQSRPARIEPYYGTTWPTTRDRIAAVELIFVAGYGAAASNVPNRFIQAIRLTVEEWFRYENNGTLPRAAMSLISGLKTGMHSGAYNVTA